MAPVLGLGNIGKRLFEGVVGLFAILGFLYVPLGHHTGFEHARAVLSTPAAAAAIDDVRRTALDLRQRAVDFVTQRVAGKPEPEADDAGERATTRARQPRPVPPPLK